MTNKTMNLPPFTRWTFALLLLWASCLAPATAQQRAGEIQHLQGMATAQQAGGSLRFLAKGDAFAEGDVITTTEKGFAILAFSDGSKITLRPSTSFAVERYAHDAGTELALFRLVRGGLRAVTGLINKRTPGAVRFTTSTATIGIRGTSFDARICGEDCRLEERAAQGRPTPPVAVPPSDSVVARVVRVDGEATALQAGKTARPLELGSPLYVGDEVKTSAQGIAVLGFRDQSRVSLNPQTVFRINGFSYNRAKEPEGFGLHLLRGGLRVFTGLIGKKDAKAVTVQTRTSTVGIRGTGMDISCEGPCIDESLQAASAATEGGAAPIPGQGDGLFMRTWQGTTYFRVPAGDLDVPLESTGFVGSDRNARLLASAPEFMLNFPAPRPDQIEIDWENLFGTRVSATEDGLYLFMRDGHVALGTVLGRSDFGIGETGFIGVDNIPRRLESVPRFISDDPFPIPEFFSQSDVRILQLFGATLGQPGQDICRL
jgi:hypothetical protein